jgi:hypothetical protein
MQKSEKTKRLEAKAAERQKRNFIIATTGVTLIIILGIIYVALNVLIGPLF